jgi:hypothetical protein
MSVLDELDKLRATLPGCTLVAFGDLATNIVLCASADPKRPQEALDALCASASDALNGAHADDMAQALAAPHLAEAIMIGAGESHVFLRSQHDAQDALFCSFDGPADLTASIAAGRSALDRIAAG